jgi:hypothetical protein
MNNYLTLIAYDKPPLYMIEKEMSGLGLPGLSQVDILHISLEDIEITKQVRKAAELLGITLEDHIIVGDQVWASLRDKGLGFE